MTGRFFYRLHFSYHQDGGSMQMDSRPVGLPSEVFEQERPFTMRLKNLSMALVAVSIVHASAALGPLLAQQATGPAGAAAQRAGRADSLATSPDLSGLERRIQSAVKK